VIARILALGADVLSCRLYPGQLNLSGRPRVGVASPTQRPVIAGSGPMRDWEEIRRCRVRGGGCRRRGVG